MSTHDELVHASGKINAQMARFIPWNRDGSIVTLTQKPLAQSPETVAWFIPDLNDISVNVDVLTGSDPRDLLYDIEFGRGHSPVSMSKNAWTLWGLVAHEMAHSMWTKWKHTPGTPAAVAGTMDMFEEIRIEARAFDRGGERTQGMLRGSFQWLLKEIAGQDIPTEPLGVAHLWALTYGRYTASIAGIDEVKPIDDTARTVLGDHAVDMLGEILSEAVTAVVDTDPSHLETLAREWLVLLGADENAKTPSTCIHGEPAEPGEENAEITEGEGEGEASGAGGEKEEEGDEEGDDADSGSDDGDVDNQDDETDPDIDNSGGGGHGYAPPKDPETAEILEKNLREISEAVAEARAGQPEKMTLSDPAEMARKVFGKKTPLTYGWDDTAPTQEQRNHAIRLAKTLERMSLPTVTRRKVASSQPPGRLRGREMVRQGADRSQGRMTTATPWEATKRTHTTSKPVVVGIMTDTSGSMGWATNFVAEFAWVMATAGQRIGARTAAVTFGDRAEMVTKPGEKPVKVRRREADGGSEAFDAAAAALDGVLHLSTPTTAVKLLFVVSDGWLVKPGEPEKAAEWLRRFTSAGTIVVWLAGSEKALPRLTGGVTGPGQLVRVPYSTPDNLMVEMEKLVIKASAVR